MSGQTNKLKSDLVIAFGFDRANADTAIACYSAGTLTGPEMSAIEYLINREPFATLGQEHMTLEKGMIEVLEHLNYKIGEARRGEG